MTVREAAKAFGSIGGMAGTGKAKTRSKAHYRRISQLAAQARKKKFKPQTNEDQPLANGAKNSC